MLKMTDEVLYRYLNAVVPDGPALMLVNLAYEVRNGLLISEVIEGDPDAPDSPDYDVAGVFGCVFLGGKSRFAAKVYELAADKDAVMDGLATKIDELPLEITVEEKGALTITKPIPSVAAAMVAAQRSDGTLAFILYRHPEVDRERATIILKAVLRMACEAATKAEQDEASGN